MKVRYIIMKKHLDIKRTPYEIKRITLVGGCGTGSGCGSGCGGGGNSGCNNGGGGGCGGGK